MCSTCWSLKTPSPTPTLSFSQIRKPSHTQNAVKPQSTYKCMSMVLGGLCAMQPSALIPALPNSWSAMRMAANYGTIWHTCLRQWRRIRFWREPLLSILKAESIKCISFIDWLIKPQNRWKVSLKGANSMKWPCSRNKKLMKTQILSLIPRSPKIRRKIPRESWILAKKTFKFSK